MSEHCVLVSGTVKVNAEKLAAQAAELFTKGSANGVYPLDSFIRLEWATRPLGG